jgi:ATP-binding cassette subfamily B protein
MFKYWKLITLTFVLTVVVSGLSIARPWIQKSPVDNIALGGDTRKLAEIVGLLVGIALLQVLCRVAQRYFFVNIQESAARDLRLDISDWLLSPKMRFTSGRDTGSVISTILQDVEKMSELYGPVVVSLCADLLKFTAVLGIMVYLSLKLTLIVIPLFILMMFLLRTPRDRYGRSAGGR